MFWLEAVVYFLKRNRILLVGVIGRRRKGKDVDDNDVDVYDVYGSFINRLVVKGTRYL